MSTWGTSWAPIGTTTAATPPTGSTSVRTAVRRIGTADTAHGQLGFQLVDHIVPQRKPLEDDQQLTLDIPLRTGRRQAAAGTTGEPRHHGIALRWISALLETANGRRDRRQLDRLLARGVDPHLGALAAAAPRPHRVHSCSPTPDVIYVVVALRIGQRVRALSTELRGDAGTSWRCTAIDLL